MRIWRKGYAAAKICCLAFLLLLMYAIRAAIPGAPVIHTQEVVLKQDLPKCDRPLLNTLWNSKVHRSRSKI